MKTTSKPGNQAQKQSSSDPTKNKSNATNPKKPNNDPDQTPDREIGSEPKAKPSKKGIENPNMNRNSVRVSVSETLT